VLRIRDVIGKDQKDIYWHHQQEVGQFMPEIKEIRFIHAVSPESVRQGKENLR
jgi:hypothetical protein